MACRGYPIVGGDLLFIVPMSFGKDMSYPGLTTMWMFLRDAGSAALRGNPGTAIHSVLLAASSNQLKELWLLMTKPFPHAPPSIPTCATGNLSISNLSPERPRLRTASAGRSRTYISAHP
jgi:hypothetical protein